MQPYTTNKKNFNSISEKELIKILLISPRLAKRIIALRPYTSFTQLDQVWGIDEGMISKINELFEISSNVNEDFENELNEVIVELDSPQIDEKVDLIERSGKSSKQVSSDNSWRTSILLILIFLLGAYFRFIGINWDESQHQHPDERYLTMVAEKIHSVSSLDEYFDTENSTLNPVGHGSYTYGMLPLFVTRYVAEWVGLTSYDAINLVGRFLSGVFDLAALWALYLVSKRLYGRSVAILTAALYSAAVFPIQLSHYFAVDSFSTFFVVLSFYFLLQAVPIDRPDYLISDTNYIHFSIFGLLVGMAGACKVNNLPVLGMIIFAGFLFIFIKRKQSNLLILIWRILFGVFLAGLLAFLSFRVFQPYAFVGPEISDVAVNEKWLNVIKEVTKQVAGDSEWPPNHHWTSRPIHYALVNMVLWGMGLPLGLMAWVGWGWAGFQIWRGDWKKHIFPFVWVFVYFIWQNIQFWRYMRYFTPIYPFLIMFAAWAIIEIFNKSSFKFKDLNEIIISNFNLRNKWRKYLSALLLLVVVLGTFSYAYAFTRIYSRPHTRVEASRWIFTNISGPLNVIIETDDDTQSFPLEVFNNRIVEKDAPLITAYKATLDGNTSIIRAPQIRLVGGYANFFISTDQAGEDKIADLRTIISDQDINESIPLKINEIKLTAGTTYYFHYRIRNNSQISFDGISLSKPDKDESKILNMKFGNQTPGIFTDSTSFQVDQDLLINQISLQNFQQKFVPIRSKVRISISNDGDWKNPLTTLDKQFDFKESGLSFDEDFIFFEIPLKSDESYQVKVELLEGEAIQFLSENFTLETSWDDYLPLKIDGYNVGGIYSPLNLELYQADTPEKRDKILEILNQSEYIIIPSNRAYDAMPRLITRYPLTLRYYQLLFGCDDCSGDELEKWAYKLEEPFSSPLGFNLVKTFVSHPNIGPIKINDQNADESFTVYDHPKVFIFKKSSNFSIEMIKKELYAVNLDDVIFQRPIDVSKIGNGLGLPPERMEAQTASGTWSEIFKRETLINQNQVFSIAVWYLFILLIGWINLPLSTIIFKSLPDRGYSLMRMVGLLALTWLVWISGSLIILKFSKGGIVLLIVLLLLLNISIYIRNKEKILNYVKSNYSFIGFLEILFLTLFVFNITVRIANPDLWHPWYGGEKPMEFAFLNSIIKSIYFPPQNPWFSEHYINYYYYGYIIAAIPIKLLGIIPAIAYNLVLPTWFAMTGVGLFGVGYNSYLGLIKNKGKISHQNDIDKVHKKLDHSPIKIRITRENIAPYLVGGFMLLFVLFMGNYFQVKLLWHHLPEVSTITQDQEAANQLISVISGGVNVVSNNEDLPGTPGRWYFAASRPILSDGPDTPIAEFPYFSFLYADLHPHLLSMPFYALGFAWCLTLLLNPLHRKKWYKQIGLLFIGGYIFGFYRVTHTWDYPIFLGLGILSFIWMVIEDKALTIEQQVKKVIVYSIIIVGFSILLYLPFSYWFRTAYSSIEIWQGARTPLMDYVIVFGMAIFMMITFLIDEFTQKSNKEINRNIPIKNLLWFLLGLGVITIGIIVLLWNFNFQVYAFIFPFIIFWFWIIFLKKNVNSSRKIVWVLFIIGFTLTLMVEVVVLKGDVGRSNMVFRMYNMAWFILGIAMSLAFIVLLKNLRSVPKIISYSWLVVFILLITMALAYPVIATGKKINDRWPNIVAPPNSLDGSLFMLGNPNFFGDKTPALYQENDIEFDLNLDYHGIKFMQDNIIGSPVIVEGHTSEYRWGGRYSIHTGLPSVIGWSWHTRQHNSLLDRSVVDRRIEGLNKFYNTLDMLEAKRFIENYMVEYVIISGLERALYDGEGLAKFQKMVENGQLSIVYGTFSDETAVILKVNP